MKASIGCCCSIPTDDGQVLSISDDGRSESVDFSENA